MKRSMVVFAMVGVCAVLSGTTLSLAATGQGGASVTIGQSSSVPITISEQVPLSFGTIDNSAGSGRVIHNLTGGIDVTGDLAIVSPGVPGEWSLQGEPSNAYVANLTSNAITLDCVDSQACGVGFLSADLNLASSNGFQFDGTGVGTLLILGNLIIGPSNIHASGPYQGSYELTVDYQ